MSKIVFRILFVICIAVTSSLIYAQQAQQPVFTIVNGADRNSSRNQVNASVNLPVLGFVTDGAGGLRPLIGIAGSASVGAPLNLGFEIVGAAIPPDHDYILAMTRDGNWPRLLHVRGNTIAVQSNVSFFNNLEAQQDECIGLDSLERKQSRCTRRASASVLKIDRIALSPTGSAAAFFSQTQGRVYVYGNLAQSPVLLATFELGRSSSVNTLAISDDGRTVLVGISDGDPSAVFLVTPQQAPRLIASLSHLAAIQFLRHSGDAIIADDIENRIYELSDGQVYSIAASEDGIAAPVGVAVSNDNRKVFVGNSQSSSVTTIGLDGTGITSTPCQCALTAFESTIADSVFRLTDFSGGPVLLFDGKAATPRMLFVRAGAQF